MEFNGRFIPKSRKKLQKNQKIFQIPLAFLWGLRYNKYTEVVKSGAKCFKVEPKLVKIIRNPLEGRPKPLG